MEYSPGLEASYRPLEHTRVAPFETFTPRSLVDHVLAPITTMGLICLTDLRTLAFLLLVDRQCSRHSDHSYVVVRIAVACESSQIAKLVVAFFAYK